jgi:drug/metabolite transporter (DMT)-like permease
VNNLVPNGQIIESALPSIVLAINLEGRVMTSTASTSITQPTRQRQLFVAFTALLAAGLLLGISTNLAKVAHGAGITPLAYLTWSLIGASLLLTMITYFRGQAPELNRRTVEYSFVAGFLTTAGTNVIFFNAIPHLGVSFIALMFSLPPLLTYVAALLLQMERFCWWRASGVVLALAGTAFLVARQWTTPDADRFWILLALFGPVLLSAGNIYRTRRWPPGASAESLAPAMIVAAIVMLFLFSFLPGWSLGLPTESTYTLPLIGVQAVIFAGQFLLLFVLQKAGGPVFLSLMGGVSAVFGVPIAMILLSEPALPAFLPSTVLIAAGIIAMLLGVQACERPTIGPRQA